MQEGQELNGRLCLTAIRQRSLNSLLSKMCKESWQLKDKGTETVRTFSVWVFQAVDLIWTGISGVARVNSETSRGPSTNHTQHGQPFIKRYFLDQAKKKKKNPLELLPQDQNETNGAVPQTTTGGWFQRAKIRFFNWFLLFIRTVEHFSNRIRGFLIVSQTSNLFIFCAVSLFGEWCPTTMKKWINGTN